MSQHWLGHKDYSVKGSVFLLYFTVSTKIELVGLLYLRGYFRMTKLNLYRFVGICTYVSTSAKVSNVLS